MPSPEELSLQQVRWGKHVLKLELEDLRRRFDENMIAAAHREAPRACGSVAVCSSEVDLRRRLEAAEAELEEFRLLRAGVLLARHAVVPCPAAPLGEIDE